LAGDPDNVSAIVCQAMASWQLGESAGAAIEAVRRATVLAPGVASISHNLSTLLASDGQMDEAAAQFMEALRIKPDDTIAFYGLSQNRRFRPDDELIATMAALHESGRLPPAAKEFSAFGLAKAYSDTGDAERAMHYAIEANGIAPRPFDLAYETRAIEALRRLAGEDAFRRAGNSGNISGAPIFIVGMNRSGTTLVESILSRHPKVLARGEASPLPILERAMQQQSRGTADRNTLAARVKNEWLAVHAQRIVEATQGASHTPFDIVTDKLPENALRLGLVARLFPGARVIHLRRHPLDVGLSNFFQRFSSGEGFSYRLDWIGYRIRQIADTMALWKRAVDLPMLDVWYEKLVADPEAESRRIVAFAGLDWAPECLEPQRTQRAVLTASQWQVRQPIYRGSAGRWTRYEQWLGPMIEALGGFDWIDSEMSAMSREAG
jgi:hypothetical protein